MKHPVELKHSFNLNADLIRVYKTGTSAEFNAKLVHEMCTARITKSSRIRSDFRGACSSELKDTMTAIYDAALMEYINELYDEDIVDNFELWSDWSVSVYRDGRALFPHTHNETFVTLCYYPETPHGLPPPEVQSPIIPFRTGELVLGNSDGFPITGRYLKDKSRMHFRYLPEAGDVVVFPGYIPHWTVPGEPVNRYCLANFVTPKPRNSQLMELV